MSRFTMARVLSSAVMLTSIACSEEAAPVSQVPTPPASTAQSPANTSTPPAMPAATPATTPRAMPVAATPPAAPPAAPAPAPATTPSAMPPAAAGMAGAGATPPSDPAMGGDPAMPAEPAAKQYTLDEVMSMNRDDLIAAWSAAPAEEIWTGCSEEYKQLEHGADGSPRDATPPIWMGKCIPESNKVLWNRGAGSTASGPAELKDSFIDMKPAVVVTYSGGTELHFRQMGEAFWLGRQTQGGSASGVWYPLGMISGDGER
jgi:hypothetical protein